MTVTLLSPRSAAARSVALLLTLAGFSTPLLGGSPGSTPGSDSAGTAATSPTATDAAKDTPRLERQYRSHIEFLANPFMEGRGPGTRGNEIAAEYIETQWRRIGLDGVFPPAPEGEDVERQMRTPPAGYRQPFRAGTRPVVKSSSISGVTTRKDGAFAAGQDEYSVLGFSGSAAVEAPVVFVGYSIEKGGPDGAYTSYPGEEARPLEGKIAMMLRFEPMNDEGKSRWRTAADLAWSGAAALTEKINTAVKRGAAGIILVNPPGCADPRAARLETAEGSGRWMRSLDVPVVMLGAGAADELVRARDSQGRSLMDLRRSADGGGGVIALGNAKLGLSVDIKREPRTTWNMAGVLRGKGALAEEYLVVGAHYDHVGYGYTGGSRTDEYGIVHPGADDNASGASGLLLAAELMKARYDAAPPDASLRSIIFVAFSAEEMGLIGSREFVKTCPVSAESIVAMLNMDMIGRLRDDKLEIAGTGTAVGFNDLLEPLLDASGFAVSNDPGGRGPSDHATFYGAGVPVLHLFTGLHDEYHTPRDTVDTINVPGAVRVVKLMDGITWMLAGRPEKLEFKSTDRGRRRRDADRADGERPADATRAADAKPGEAKADAAAAPAGDPHGAGGPKTDTPGSGLGGVRVRFGIAPGNYAEGEDGVLVGEVYPGTSAAEAGILAGDRLMKWNGRDIGDVQGWMDLLGEHKPGDVVDVTLKRKGEDVTVRVTLKARDQAVR